MAEITSGFNKDVNHNQYLYERIVATALDHALKNNITRINFGMVDSLNKLHLSDAFNPLSMYAFSSDLRISEMIHRAEKSNDMHQLSLLEERIKNDHHD